MYLNGIDDPMIGIKINNFYDVLSCDCFKIGWVAAAKLRITHSACLNKLPMPICIYMHIYVQHREKSTHKSLCNKLTCFQILIEKKSHRDNHQ